MNMNFGWSSAHDDAKVQKATSNIIERGVALAKEMRLDDPFIYINYASLEQDVYSGFGQKSLNRLKVTKKKYDPLNVFGRLWPGYFKL